MVSDFVLTKFHGRMVNSIRLKGSRWQDNYILVTLFWFVFSYGCAISEPEVQIVGSSPAPVYGQSTELAVSASSRSVKNDHAVSSLKTPLSKQEIRQIQARLKAAGFNPGPVDGILGPRTRSVLLRIQAGCTIVDELVAISETEIFAPAAKTQPPELTGFTNTLSKAETRLIQTRLKTAGFDPGPIDGILGPRTRSAISRCKSGCTALNDLLGSSAKRVSGQTAKIQSPPASASAISTVSINKVLSKEEIRLAQERLKTAGFDPGLLDGILGPKTRAALDKYRSSHKLTRSGLEALLDY